jgi:hypothetical protein
VPWIFLKRAEHDSVEVRGCRAGAPISKELGVTKERLIEVIRQVGPMVEDVRRELKK